MKRIDARKRWTSRVVERAVRDAHLLEHSIRMLQPIRSLRRSDAARPLPLPPRLSFLSFSPFPRGNFALAADPRFLTPFPECDPCSEPKSEGIAARSVNGQVRRVIARNFRKRNEIENYGDYRNATLRRAAGRYDIRLNNPKLLFNEILNAAMSMLDAIMFRY